MSGGDGGMYLGVMERCVWGDGGIYLGVTERCVWESIIFTYTTEETKHFMLVSISI